MDWLLDAESFCSAAVPQRTGRKMALQWVGWSWEKWDSSDSRPSFSSPCAMAVSSALTHSNALYWEFICSFLRDFDLPLYSATELQRAPVWGHPPARFSFQIPLGQCCSAAISTSLCAWGCTYTPDSKISLSAPVMSLTRPYHGTGAPVVLPWHILILCPHVSPAAPWKAARSCSASQWWGSSSLLPFCCSS